MNTYSKHYILVLLYWCCTATGPFISLPPKGLIKFYLSIYIYKISSILNLNTSKKHTDISKSFGGSLLLPEVDASTLLPHVKQRQLLHKTTFSYDAHSRMSWLKAIEKKKKKKNHVWDVAVMPSDATVAPQHSVSRDSDLMFVSEWYVVSPIKLCSFGSFSFFFFFISFLPAVYKQCLA